MLKIASLSAVVVALASCGGSEPSAVVTDLPAPSSVLQPVQETQDSGDSREEPVDDSSDPSPSNPVRFGIDPQYPPANFVNDEGNYDGFEPVLREEVCRRAQLECVWVQNEWVSLIPNLIAGKFDVILSLMYNTPERDELIDFSEVYQPSEPSVYVAKTGAGEDVLNGVVAAISVTVQAQYVEEQTPAVLLALDTQQETVQAVLDGDAAALLSDRESAKKFVTDSDGQLEIIGDEVLFPQLGSAMGFRESDDELRARISAAIASMKTEGSLNSMIIKWFGPDAHVFAARAIQNGDQPTG